MSRGNVYSILIIMAVIGAAIMCGNKLSKPNTNKWDTIIERCHDVSGHDYSGCLERENLEWSRGGSGTH